MQDYLCDQVLVSRKWEQSFDENTEQKNRVESYKL